MITLPVNLDADSNSHFSQSRVLAPARERRRRGDSSSEAKWSATQRKEIGGKLNGELIESRAEVTCDRKYRFVTPLPRGGLVNKTRLNGASVILDRRSHQGFTPGVIQCPLDV